MTAELLSTPVQNLGHFSSLSDLAGLYKACGDELRIEILRILKSDSFGVLELSDIFDVKQSTMSHHLKILSTHGLVQTRREGNSIFYQRTVNTNHAHLHALFQEIDLSALQSHTLNNIKRLKQQRADLGKAFFSKNIKKFREQQELIAQFEQYQAGCLNMLQAAKPNTQSIVELGPGEGLFLADLAAHFDKVIALDYAKEMLNQARVFSLSQGLNNIEFVLGECQDLIQRSVKTDAVVMNMVLHHLPSPADCFKEIAMLLEDDGVLVLSDLCKHEQSWARDACGDLWLGFEEQELKQWAMDAGLSFQQSSFLALRNGFQILFFTFKKSTHSHN